MRRWSEVRKWCRICLASAAVLMVASCSGRTSGGESDEGVPSLTVSIPPLEYFANAIGGDSLKVNVLLETGTDPETFQPGMGAMRALQKSGALAVTGVLPFERVLTDGMHSASGVRVFDMSEGVELMYGTHTHDGAAPETRHDGEDVHDCHGAPDPHIWSSYKNARVMARNMYDAIAGIAPMHAGYYKRRYEELDKALAAADSVAADALSGGRAFLIWHPALSYMARDYGMVQVAVNSENKENSSQGLRRVMQRADSLQPHAFIISPGTNSGSVRAVSAEVGIRPVEVDFLSADWEGHMKKIVDTLR
ncbi:MAG: zinc ABC transporter substrate-binding protein [Muribaculaceae bacterium]|nr:zinc ABC transporter substrate-binding protein [Muribaculaceae bacterium]